MAEALSGNEIMTELNIASNYLGKKTWSGDADMLGVVAISDAIPTMGALETVTIDQFPLPIQDIKTKAELDFSGKKLGIEDAIFIAALVPLNVSER